MFKPGTNGLCLGGAFQMPWCPRFRISNVMETDFSAAALLADSHNETAVSPVLDRDYARVPRSPNYPQLRYRENLWNQKVILH